MVCPSDLTVPSAAGQCSAVVNVPLPAATDNCAVANLSGVRDDSKPLSDPYPVGTTTITWTADDGHGNSVSCPQRIIVTDSQAPTMVCPSDMTVPSAAGQCSALVSVAVPGANNGRATGSDRG